MFDLHRARGEEHGGSKLTWQIVRAIREEYRDPEPSFGNARLRPSQRALARKYGVSQTTVYRIVSGKAWVDPTYTPPTQLRTR